MDNENEVIENDNNEVELIEVSDELELENSNEVENDGAQSNDDTNDSNEEEETQAQMFTQDEVDKMIASRVNRLEREYQKKFKENEGLINTLKAGLGKDNVNEIESDLRSFYSEQGIKIPEQPKYDEYEEKILARAYSDEIIQAGESEMEKVANQIASKPYEQRSIREIETLNILGKELMERKEVSELKSKGIDTSILNEQKFKDFRSKLNPKINVSEAIDLYNKVQSKEIKRPANPGSATSVHTESKYKDFYTSEEVDNLSKKDLDNPQIFNAVINSMNKW